MTLEQANVGDRVVVGAIADPETATMAMRLGIAEGAELTLVSKVPGGPVVVQRGKVEIALGRALCKDIGVSKVTP